MITVWVNNTSYHCVSPSDFVSFLLNLPYSCMVCYSKLDASCVSARDALSCRCFSRKQPYDLSIEITLNPSQQHMVKYQFISSRDVISLYNFTYINFFNLSLFRKQEKWGCDLNLGPKYIIGIFSILIEVYNYTLLYLNILKIKFNILVTSVWSTHMPKHW